MDLGEQHGMYHVDVGPTKDDNVYNKEKKKQPPHIILYKWIFYYIPHFIRSNADLYLEVEHFCSSCILLCYYIASFVCYILFTSVCQVFLSRCKTISPRSIKASVSVSKALANMTFDSCIKVYYRPGGFDFVGESKRDRMLRGSEGKRCYIGSLLSLSMLLGK